MNCMGAKKILLYLFIFISWATHAQRPIHLLDNEQEFQKGFELIEKEKFVAARHQFDQIIRQGNENESLEDAYY